MERAIFHGQAGSCVANQHACKVSTAPAPSVPGHRAERQAGVPAPAQAGTGTPAASAFDRLPSLGIFDLARELTGYEVHADTWLDSRNERAKLQVMTDQLVEKLREGGIEPLRKSQATISIVGVCTGKVEVVTQYRNINFLPVVAAANRSQVLRRMDFFAQSRPFLRYGVVTNGPRCPISELRTSLCALGRAVSNFGSRAELKSWGVELVFRGSEFTVRREADGLVTCHPHANVVFNFSRRLAPEQFREFLRFAHEQFPGHWRDCGRLREAAEAVKYITKPAELLGLSSGELCALQKAVHGLKLVQPMGEFAALGRRLKGEGVKLGKRLVQGVWRWCKVRKAGRDGGPTEARGESKDVVLSVLPPQPRFVPRLEPCLLVMNFSGDLVAAVEKANLGEMLCPALEAWMRPPLSFTPTRQLPTAETSGKAAVSPVPPGESTPSRAGSHNPGVCRVGGALGGKVGVSGEAAAATARPASRLSGGKIEAAGNGCCGAVELLNP